jgi:hypothetical protein
MTKIDMLSSIVEKTAHGSFYYEPQTEPDTCFQHAINMYFQKKYLLFSSRSFMFVLFIFDD